MIERPRLLPAVILGAMGLLALKLLAWTSPPSPGAIPAYSPVLAASAEAAAKPKPEVAGLARTIAQAPAPDRFWDPETTGSVDKPDAKAEAGKPPPAAAQAPGPANRAGVINGTAAPVSASERAILERLGERREEIEARMRELEMRERLLESAEKRLDGRVGDLKEAEEKNAAATPNANAEEGKAIKNLVIMYEAMKPKDAARVFDRLGLDVLVPVVRQMNPRKMSEVLAAMAPERAEKLTVALAPLTRGPARPAIDAAPLPTNELPAIAPPARR